MPTPTRERLNLSKTTCNIRLGKGLAKIGQESVTSPNADTHTNLRTKEQKKLVNIAVEWKYLLFKKSENQKTHTHRKSI